MSPPPPRAVGELTGASLVASGAQARLGKELQWYVWNLLWQSANAVAAAHGPAARRDERLRKLDEDTARVHRHQRNVKAAGSFPAEALERLRSEAELAGEQAALAAVRGGAASRAAEGGLEPPRDLPEGLWAEMAKAIRLGADVVAGVLLDEMRPSRAQAEERRPVQKDFEQVWDHLCAALPASGAGGATEAAEPSPDALVRECRWYTWNLTWHAANGQLASGAQGGRREQKLAAAEEDKRRSDEHLSRMEAVSAELLGLLQRRALEAGRAAASAALDGQPLVAEDAGEAGAAVGTRVALDAGVAQAVDLGAAAVSETLLDELGHSHKEAGRALQADFDHAWRQLGGGQAPATGGHQGDLKWYVWNTLWSGANAARASSSSGSKREDRLRRADEDRERGEQHLQAARASLPAAARATALELGRRAERAGRRAAEAALAGRPLLGAALEAAAPLEEAGLAGHWPGAAAALRLGARAVAELLLDELQPSHAERARALEARCKQAWKRLGPGLLLRAAEPSGKPPPATQAGGALQRLPTQVGEELKWFVWNVMWRAANSEAGSKGSEDRRAEKLRKADDDARRSEEHLRFVQAAKTLSQGTLQCLQRQAETLGRSAASAAMRGRASARSGGQIDAPPDEIGPQLWAEIVEALRLGAAATAETLLDEYDASADGYAATRPLYVEAQALQAAFKADWHEAFRRLPQASALDAEDRALESDLRWMIWNEIWQAANSAIAEQGATERHEERARRAEEDGRRSAAHEASARSLGLLPAAAVSLLKRQAGVAGRAAAAAATDGLPLQSGAAAPLAPCADFEGEQWRELARVIAVAAAAATEVMLDDLAQRGAQRHTPKHRFRALVLEADFQCAWHRLYESPPPAALRAPGTAAASARPRAALPALAPAQAAQYRRDGCLGPLRALDAAGLRRCRDGLGRLFDLHAGLGSRGMDAHLTMPWLHELACQPSLVGAVASALGTETVLLYQSIIILRSAGKSGREETGIDWHADGFGYLGLGPLEDFVTAFIALTPCTRSSGCLEYAPEGGGNNVFLELQPGDFSIHSAGVSHHAIKNSSSHRRDCIILRFISGRVRDLAADVDGEPRDWAVLACGHDTEGHFRLLPPPEEEYGTACLKRWSEVKQLRDRRKKLGKLK